LNNVVLPGRINRSQVEAIARHSHLGIAPIRNNPDYLLSVPNKVVDYFSLGLPVLTSLQGEVLNLLNHWDAGIVYSTNDQDSLYQSLDNLLHDDITLKRLSMNASKLYESEFNGDAIYEEAVSRISAIALSQPINKR
jgi:glycosyltransferase involved in cell wall biosynthesis